MKVCIVLFSLAMTLQSFGLDILRPEQRLFIDNVEYISKKDMTTIPGKVIIYKNRGGKLYSVNTQECFRLTGKVNFNPLARKFSDATNSLNLATIRAQAWSNDCALIQYQFVLMSNRWAKVQASLESIRQRNEEAEKDLDDLAKKHPLLSAIINAIKEKIHRRDDD